MNMYALILTGTSPLRVRVHPNTRLPLDFLWLSPSSCLRCRRPHLQPSSALYALRSATGPPTAIATTAAPARSTRIVDTGRTASTAACAKGSHRGHRRHHVLHGRLHLRQVHQGRPALCALRTATGPPTAIATTAAPARSTRIVDTARTASTAARAKLYHLRHRHPRHCHRRRPPSRRRRPSPALRLS